MDGKTFLLGFIPPLLAFLAEAKNPVSARSIRLKAESHAVQHVLPATDVKPGVAYDQQAAKNALVNAMVAVGEVAGEVSGIVPTWISIASATVAIFADIVPNMVVLLVILVLVTGGFALLAIWYFQGIDYQNEALVASGKGFWPCRRAREVDCISCWIKVANLAVAGIVAVVALATSGLLPDL